MAAKKMENIKDLAPTIGPKQMTQLIHANLDRPSHMRHNLLFKGAPGVGKTDLIKQAFKSYGADLLVMHPVISDPTDFKGLPWIVEGRADFIPFNELRTLINVSKLTGVFFDDAGQAMPAVQAALMQLIWGGQIGQHKINNDKVVFMLATNRKQDRAAVGTILKPLLGRCLIYELQPLLDDWLQWYFKQDLPAEIAGFVRFKPDMLFKDDAGTKDDKAREQNMENAPCPRTIHMMAKELSCKPALDTEFQTYSACAGPACAVEFMAFLDVYRSLPNIDLMLKHPEKSQDQIPHDKPSVLYALCGALAKRASKKTFAALVEISKYLPKEFGVMMIRDSVHYNEEVAETEEFIQWAGLYSDVLI